MKRIVFLGLILFLTIGSCNQQENKLLTSKPEKVGMSSERLDRIKPIMQNYIDENKLPGLITMIARHGKIVHFEKYGNMYIDKPMELDAIFSIASMTKPIVSVAIMMLYEEGYLQLYDPVEKYIPEFKDLKVFSYKDKSGIYTVDQIRPMSIRDLLTHTSGLCYGEEDSPVDSIFNAADVFDGTLKDMILKLSKMPLLFQPGTEWNYSVSTDVLGYLIEAISGKPLDIFFKERIFRPLKMEDTDFYVPAAKKNRIAALYGPSDSTGIKVVVKTDTLKRILSPSKFLSGGGGLFSTAKDYMIFSQMLLNKGEYDGVRLLSRKTINYMTLNHLSDDLLPTKGYAAPRPGNGFGLGFAVVQDVAQIQIVGSAGTYWWAGAYGTFFQIDPSEHLILILLTHIAPGYFDEVDKFVVLTYQAIVD
jgi:CubicO group peptidase (beta-lactamase class C family)